MLKRLQHDKKTIPFPSLFTVHPIPQGEGVRGRVGFTLLEIMIALAIVGAVVIAVLHTVNYHADVAYEQTIATTMFLIAKEKIIDMELNPENAKGIVSGTNFTYENSVNTTEDDEIVELKTIISGYGKEITLREFVVKKQMGSKK